MTGSTPPGAGIAPGGATRRTGARGLAGFIVPRADEHQGEYVPRRVQRLAWLTGFTGSAGLAIVLADARGDLRRRALHACRCAARSTPTLFEIRT